MKKVFFVTGMLAFMTTFTAAAAHAVSVGLDEAIGNSVERLSAGMGSGAGVTVLSMQAGSTRMSNFLIDEMNRAFVDSGSFAVVNRTQLDLLAGQLYFSISEWVRGTTPPQIERSQGVRSTWANVSPEGAAGSIARYMGVQYVVMGTFELEPRREFFRFRAQAFEAETGEIRAVYTANVESSDVIAFLLAARDAEPLIAYMPQQAYEQEATYEPQPLTPFARRQPREPRERRTVTADEPRVNWFSAEVTVVGVGLRYERDINNVFTMGGTVWFSTTNVFEDTPVYYIGAMITARFFLGSSPLYFELGAGFGNIGQDVYHEQWGYDWESTNGLMIAPAIGLRFGGQTAAGLFANPFISLPLVLGEDSFFRFGIGLGITF